MLRQSDFTGIGSGISEFDTTPQIQLPFGDWVSVVDGAYQHDDDGTYAPAQFRDVSLTQELDQLATETDEGDQDENVDVQMSDNANEDNDDDFQPLAYAREHGLTANYFDEDPLRTSYLPSPPTSMLADNEFLVGSKPDDLKEFKTMIAEAGNERWDIDRQTAEILTSVMVMSRGEEVDNLVNIKRMSELKIDEPVLFSDPGVDLSRLRGRNTVRVSTSGMQPCPVDTEKGEGLPWSSEHCQIPSTISQSIANEKLDVDQETMELLKDIMSPVTLSHRDEVEQAIESRRLRKQTPPLLPLSPPLSPNASLNAAHEMEFTSTPDNLFAGEAAEVEARLFNEDNDISRQVGDSSRTIGSQCTSDDIQQFIKTPNASSSSPLRQKRLRDLKEDTPLLAQEQESSPAKRTKSVSFPEHLHTLIPAPDADDSMEGESEHPDIDVFITDVVVPMAQPVIDAVGNEKLDELDTTLRLIAPTLDVVDPTPPWICASNEETTHSSLTAQGFLLLRIEKEMPNGRKKWPGLSKLEQMLPWTPFPRCLGKINIAEQFDDGSCERYLVALSLDDESTNVETLLWKADGIRLLDRSERDDEELETAGIEHDDAGWAANTDIVQEVSASLHVPAANPPQTTSQRAEPPRAGLAGMQALLERRRLQLAAGSNSTIPVSTKTSMLQKADQMAIDQSDASTLNLALGGLQGFLGLQGAKTLQMHDLKPGDPEKVNAKPVQAMTVQPPAEPEDLRLPCVLPSPHMSDPQRAMSVVISSGMLANRQLIREVQALLPGLDLIERDPASLSSTTGKSSSACEADLTLSPGTGLVCTTLQKVKQKPLPGQTNFSGIRERIASVSPRYERCIVLVSEGRQDELLPTRSLDERDTGAINDLMAFCINLEASIEVCYVPGSEADMAKWIAASVCRCCSTDGETKLFHDETMWERVLRTAGANPIAAQAILAKLKRPEAVEASESSSSYCSSTELPYGLSAFLQRSVEERVQRFGPLMGGDRVIGRISEVLDSGWMTASWQ